MTVLNPKEKIHSWEIVFTTKVDNETATHIPVSLRSRKLMDTELGIDWPVSITERVDEIVENMYPVTWDKNEVKNENS